MQQLSLQRAISGIDREDKKGYALSMEIGKYLIKRITYYILSALGIMIAYGVLLYGGVLELSGWKLDLLIAVALLAYPAYRTLYGTVRVIADYLDDEKEAEENLFAYLCEEAAPRFIAGKSSVIYLLNLISKIMQICFIGGLGYSFVADDQELFVGLMVVTAIIMFMCLSLLIRIPAVQFMKQRNREAEEMRNLREKAGILIDSNRRRRFLKRPRTVIAADLALAVLGILQMSFMPFDVSPLLYHAGAVVRTFGILAMVCMPLCIYYFFREHYRSTSFVVEIGKGEYGQIKVEFWQYEGSGDDREKKRNKIDRLESLTVTARYIKVRKIGQLWHIRIPRTINREFELLDTLSLMRN